MRSATRKAVSILGAATLSLSFAAVMTQSASARPATGRSAHQATRAKAHPTQRLCSTPKRAGVMACFAIRRLDSLNQHVSGNALPSGYGPADLQSAYSLAGVNAAGRVVAIVDAYDDPNAESDLAAYRSTYGLPACTTANGCFKKVNQNGVQGSYPAATRAGPARSASTSTWCPRPARPATSSWSRPPRPPPRTSAPP